MMNYGTGTLGDLWERSMATLYAILRYDWLCYNETHCIQSALTQEKASSLFIIKGFLSANLLARHLWGPNPYKDDVLSALNIGIGFPLWSFDYLIKMSYLNNDISILNSDLGAVSI